MNDVMTMPISFESQIIDDVIKKTGGKYSFTQIQDVLRASISYAHNLCIYSDNVSVTIPYIGEIVCNLHEMKSRKHNLERLKGKVERLYPHQEKELAVLETKIRDIMESREKGEIKDGDMLIKYNKSSVFKSRKGYSFKEIQSIQEQEFKR